LMKKLFMGLMAIIMATIIAFGGGNISPVAPVVEGGTGFYAGGMVGGIQNYESGDLDWFNDGANNFSNPAIGADIGYTFYNGDLLFAAIEGRVLTTFNAEDADTTIYGMYLKPGFKTTDNIKLYGLFGGSYVRWNVGSVSEHKTGASFGGGVSYALSNSVEVFTDYTCNLWEVDALNNGKLNTDSVVVGFNYKF